ncbi:KIR protein [Plasmodium coatneyi]|uniref:KIR protein n=1 Tax=Plasmodium coatneyi TaxID=208452 RepID=A0A1B1DWK7_9APIC|nr:KIR protein [Plasmodium coatneyi]ANQ07191.1 KIR protein [Plasmodium coatneyi]
MVTKDACLDKLPSQKIYAAFEQNNGGKQQCKERNSVTKDIENILKDKLNQHWKNDEKKCAKKITEVWCDVSELTSKKQACTVICDFFYLWLHNKLSNILGPFISVENTMRDIYTKLEGRSSGNQCSYETTRGNNGENFLQWRKLIFDYYYDYRTIWNKLKDCRPPECSCKRKYDGYLNGAKSAYSQVEANCGSELHSNDAFCTKFWNKKFQQSGSDGDGGRNPIPKPGDLKNKAMRGESPSSPPGEEGDEEEHLRSCLEQLSAASIASSEHTSTDQLPQVEGGGSGVAPIVSSTVATLVGLPAVAFFLYKVYNYNL